MDKEESKTMQEISIFEKVEKIYQRSFSNLYRIFWVMLFVVFVAGVVAIWQVNTAICRINMLNEPEKNESAEIINSEVAKLKVELSDFQQKVSRQNLPMEMRNLKSGLSQNALMNLKNGLNNASNEYERGFQVLSCIHVLSILDNGKNAQEVYGNYFDNDKFIKYISQNTTEAKKFQIDSSIEMLDKIILAMMEASANNRYLANEKFKKELSQLKMKIHNL